MNKNKKKVFAIALAVCLIALISFGTLAYFTDTDSVTNTFTIGSIKVQQNEWDEFGSHFVQNQVMLPIVNTQEPSKDPNYIHKVVTVSNTGANDAYVRTFIAVDSRIAPYLYLDLNVADGWVREADQTTTIDGNAYKVLVFTYNKELPAGATTPTLLKGVYLDAKMDVKTFDGVQQFCYWDSATGAFVSIGYPVSSGVQVYVATQAVQVRGFEDVGASGAIQSAFNGALPTFVSN